MVAEVREIGLKAIGVWPADGAGTQIEFHPSQNILDK
jgi:hypothetical protein